MECLLQLPPELFAGVLESLYLVAPLWSWLPLLESYQYYVLRKGALRGVHGVFLSLITVWEHVRKCTLACEPSFRTLCIVSPVRMVDVQLMPPLPMSALRWYTVYEHMRMPNAAFRKRRPIRAVPYDFPSATHDCMRIHVQYPSTDTYAIQFARVHSPSNFCADRHQRYMWHLLRRERGTVLFLP